MAAGFYIEVVGGDEGERAPVLGALRAAGLEGGGRPQERDPRSSLVVAVGDDPARVCRELREVSELTDVPILAVVGAGADEPAACLAAGADDVIAAPVEAGVLGARARCLLRSAAEKRRARTLEGSQEALLKVHALMAAGGDAPEILRTALGVAVETLALDRGSLVAHVAGSDHGYVIAATDDPTLSQFALAIADYPELREAIESGEPLLVGDVHEHPVTAAISGTLESHEVRSLAVFPVVWKQRGLGAVLLRSRRAGAGNLSPAQVGFGKLFADQAAAQLRDDRVADAIREQTHRMSRASYEVERRLRTIDSLKEHFEAAGDGVVVIDGGARILFVNRAAEGITGFARDGLLGAELAGIVPRAQRGRLAEVIERVLGGVNLDPFDLDMTTTSGEEITVSITTSTVLSQSGAAVFSFRDVTAQRVVEAELHKTKDFLERLIDSTVDAIVAADMRGHVILFNSGAERIYGRPAEDVIGRVPVWGLYPKGVARQVMRMLRSTSYGGVGRLEQTRREVLTSDGEVVPVNLSASIIYEGDREVATVGIFSDLRERIRIEQRLLEAQEKLELREKQAMVAELAGAAAHELNQPLTSIMGYTALIRRHSDSEAPHLRAVDVIDRETERMAEIVKKIGRITRFETKEYVGGASILDLERSARDSARDLPARELDPELEIDAPEAGADDNPIERAKGDGDEDDDDEPTRRIGFGKSGPSGRGS